MTTYVEEFTKIAQADSGLAVLVPIGESPYFQQSAASFSALAALGEPFIATIVSPALGDTIRYDGTKWVNSAFLRNLGTATGGVTVGSSDVYGYLGTGTYLHIREDATLGLWHMMLVSAVGSRWPYFHVIGDGTGGAEIAISSYGVPTGSYYTSQGSRGTRSVPAHLQAGDLIAQYQYRGFKGTGAFPEDWANAAFHDIRAPATWTDTSRPTSFDWWTTAVGSVTPTKRMVIDSDGSIIIGVSDPGGSDLLRVNGTGAFFAGVSASRSSGGTAVLNVVSAGTHTGDLITAQAGGNAVFIVNPSGGLSWLSSGTFRWTVGLSGAGGLQLQPTASALNTNTFWLDSSSNIQASLDNATGFFEAKRLKVASVNGVICANAALATTATDGFIYLPSCAGVPTGVPTTQTGTVACVVDTTNKRVYLYLSGAWFNLVGDSIPG